MHWFKLSWYLDCWSAICYYMIQSEPETLGINCRETFSYNCKIKVGLESTQILLMELCLLLVFACTAWFMNYQCDQFMYMDVCMPVWLKLSCENCHFRITCSQCNLWTNLLCFLLLWLWLSDHKPIPWHAVRMALTSKCIWFCCFIVETCRNAAQPVIIRLHVRS